MQRASSEFESVVTTSLTEVEIAVREVLTTYNEMVGRYHAMLAATNETLYLWDRYEFLPDLNDSAPLLLEDLLDAQERQADEEAAFVDAEVNYAISLMDLRKAMGTLFSADLYGCSTPQLHTGQTSAYLDVSNPGQLPPAAQVELPTVPEQPFDGPASDEQEVVPPPSTPTAEPLPQFPLDLPSTDAGQEGRSPRVPRTKLPLVSGTKNDEGLFQAKSFSTVEPGKLKW
jgi:hypothetical protein